MAKGLKICRVCGKEYEACHTLRPNLDNEFRWQEVACSPECGQAYLRAVLIARGELVEDAPAEAEEAPEKTTTKKSRAKKTAIEP
jgi:hypothetical protein